MQNDATTTALVVSEVQSLDAPATRSRSDAELVASWVEAQRSTETRYGYATVGRRFLVALEGLGVTLRSAAVEDIRQALGVVTDGRSQASAQQYTSRVKSLLSYAHRLGYTRFNAGTVIRTRPDDKGERAARIASKRISETEVALLLRAAGSPRDRCMLALTYAGGLRVSEVIRLRWKHVTPRDDGMAQLSVRGKGDKTRQILVMPEVVAELAAFRGSAGDEERVLKSERGESLSRRAAHAIIKSCVQKAGIPEAVSMHWLRHAHASHALERGAPLVLVKENLGHEDISTTSIYLHAKPGDGSGLYLDKGVFKRRE